MVKALLLLCTLCFAGFSYGQTQNRNFHISHFSVEQGLSQSSVSTILEDNRGFMWFGTQDGLNRFDAYEFKVFRSVSADSNSISDNWVKGLCQDNKGYIWVGTWLRGINRFDPRTQKFSRYTHLPHTRIHHLFKDRAGNIWIVSAEGLSRIYYDSQGNEHIINYEHLYKRFLKNTSVFKVLVDRRGNCWLGTLSEGLIKIPYTTLQTPGSVDGVVIYKRDLSTLNSLLSNQVRSLAEDQQGHIWIGTAEGLHCLNPVTGAITRYVHEVNNVNSPSENDIWGLLVDSRNNLWIGTYSTGINRFDISREIFTRYSPEMLSDFNRIEALYEDSKGNFWFGTLLGGVNYYDPNKYYFNTIKKGEPGKGLNDNVVRSFYKDKQGIIWIGTQNGGLNRYDRQTGTFEYFTISDKPDRGMPEPYVKAVCGDDQGNIWVGTRKHGVVQLSFKNKQPVMTYFRHNAADSTGLATDFIAAMWIDRDRQLWVCTYEGNLNKYDPHTKKFRSFKQPSIASSEYNEQNPVSAYDNGKGFIWVGGSSGLVRFNKANGAVEFFKSGTDSSCSLPVCNIKCIYQEREGIVWLGTSKGLIRFDYHRKRQQLYELRHGLPSEMIYGILPDQQYNLWMSTNKGISRFNLVSRTFRNYTTGDGLQHNEFNTGAYYKSADGEMMFGGINGFNLFNPDELKDNPNLPRLALTDFKLHHLSVKPSARSVLKQSICETSEITLHHTDKIISFEFTALNFSNPEKNKFAYIMENFDEHWTYTDAHHREATYTNLPPGEYVFRMKGSNNDGVWNEKTASIRISVTPPFWQTWWFRTGALLVVIVTAFTSYRLRVNHIKTINQKLKLLVEERTSEILQQNVELEQQQEEILAQRDFIEQRNRTLEEAQAIIQQQNQKLQSANSELEQKVQERTNELSKAYIELLHAHEELDNFVYRAAHDLKGPIMRMLGLCNIAALDVEDLRALDYIDRIGHNARDLDQILSRLLIVDKIKQKNLNHELIDVKKAVEDILHSLSQTDGFLEMQFDLQIPDGLHFYSDTFLIDVILQNMIKNSIDYRFNSNGVAPCVEIEITASEETFLMIYIRDNGAEIPAGYYERIFDMFVKANENSKGSGLGLYVVKTAVERLKGCIRLVQSGSHRNVFEVKLPMNSEQSSVISHQSSVSSYQ